ncbi:MAG: hypothetical protein JXR37_18970 [Kiritimatiellae bacterium]|nr:hypothetical protein [Kiritimatiellia bacterium]
MHERSWVIVVLVLLTLVVCAYSGEPGDWRCEVNAFLSYVMFNADAAERGGIAETGYAAGGEFGIGYGERLIIKTGLGLVQAEDNDSFTETVTYLYDYGDEVWEEESEVQGLSAFLEVDYRHRFPRPQVYAGLGLGTLFIDLTRKIPNCRDSPTEEVDVDGGLYGVVFAGYRWPGIKLEAAYTHVLGDDGVQSMATLSLGHVFRPLRRQSRRK